MEPSASRTVNTLYQCDSSQDMEQASTSTAAGGFNDTPTSIGCKKRNILVKRSSQTFNSSSSISKKKCIECSMSEDSLRDSNSDDDDELSITVWGSGGSTVDQRKVKAANCTPDVKNVDTPLSTLSSSKSPTLGKSCSRLNSPQIKKEITIISSTNTKTETEENLQTLQIMFQSIDRDILENYLDVYKEDDHCVQFIANILLGNNNRNSTELSLSNITTSSKAKYFRSSASKTSVYTSSKPASSKSLPTTQNSDEKVGIDIRCGKNKLHASVRKCLDRSAARIDIAQPYIPNRIDLSKRSCTSTKKQVISPNNGHVKKQIGAATAGIDSVCKLGNQPGSLNIKKTKDASSNMLNSTASGHPSGLIEEKSSRLPTNNNSCISLATSKPEVAQNVGYRSTPMATSKPEVAQNVGYRSTPMATSKPEVPQNVGYRSTPLVTSKPEVAQNVGYRSVPLATSKPEVAQNVGYRSTPLATSKPEVAQNVGYRSTPMATSKPEVAQNVGYRSTPMATSKPEVAQNVGYRSTPLVTSKPEVAQNVGFRSVPLATSKPEVAQNVGYRSTPLATSKPEVAQNVGYSSTPMATSKPEVPQNVGYRSTPLVTSKPEVAQNVGYRSVPLATSKPEVAQNVGYRSTPLATSKPEVAQNVGYRSTPMATSKPEVAQNVGYRSTPMATSKPEVAQNVGYRSTPLVTSKPEVAQNVGFRSVPLATSKPEVAQNVGYRSTPLATSKPEVAQNVGYSSTPMATSKPEVTQNVGYRSTPLATSKPEVAQNVGYRSTPIATSKPEVAQNVGYRSTPTATSKPEVAQNVGYRSTPLATSKPEVAQKVGYKSSPLATSKPEVAQSVGYRSAPWISPSNYQWPGTGCCSGTIQGNIISSRRSHLTTTGNTSPLTGASHSQVTNSPMSCAINQGKLPFQSVITSISPSCPSTSSLDKPKCTSLLQRPDVLSTSGHGFVGAQEGHITAMISAKNAIGDTTQKPNDSSSFNNKGDQSCSNQQYPLAGTSGHLSKAIENGLTNTFGVLPAAVSSLYNAGASSVSLKNSLSEGKRQPTQRPRPVTDLLRPAVTDLPIITKPEEEQQKEEKLALDSDVETICKVYPDVDQEYVRQKLHEQKDDSRRVAAIGQGLANNPNYPKHAASKECTNQVTWFWEDEVGKLIAFSEIENIVLERHFQRKKDAINVEVRFPGSSGKCYLNFVLMAMTNHRYKIISVVRIEDDYKEMNTGQEVKSSGRSVVPRDALSPPSNWQPQTNSAELIVVRPGSSEFEHVERMLKNSLAKATVTHIQRVQNKWLYKKYAIQRSLLKERNGVGKVNEMELFHGTKANPPEVIWNNEDGFDMRYSAGGMWGQGTYFAVDAAYCHHGFVFQSIHDKSATVLYHVFLAHVLTGDTICLDPDRSIRMPPVNERTGTRYDSITGGVHNHQIYIVYKLEKAYPAYLITYTM